MRTSSSILSLFLVAFLTMETFGQKPVFLYTDSSGPERLAAKNIRMHSGEHFKPFHVASEFSTMQSSQAESQWSFFMKRNVDTTKTPILANQFDWKQKKCLANYCLNSGFSRESSISPDNLNVYISF